MSGGDKAAAIVVTVVFGSIVWAVAIYHFIDRISDHKERLAAIEYGYSQVLVPTTHETVWVAPKEESQ